MLNEPGLVDDALALHTVLYPAPAAEPTIQSIFDAVAGVAPLREHVLQALESRCGSGELLSSDALILEQLARAPGAKLSPVLIDALWKRAAAANSDDIFEALGSALAAEDSPAAKDVKAWVTVRLRMNRNGVPLSPPDARPIN